MKYSHPLALRMVVVLATALRAATPCAGSDPLTPDEAAAVLLDSANRACNEQHHDLAIERFREFAKLYGGHRDLARAEYGLGLALMEGPRKDYTNAAQAFQSASVRGDFAARPFVLYYLGAARRAMAEQELARAATLSSPEATQRRATANQRFAEAAGSFADAANAFLARVGTPRAATERPADLNWAARARCDGADLLLRLGRFKEAAEAADAFLRDTGLSRSPYRELAVYHQGYARFELKEYATAGRALSTLAPFGQPFGLHARYLLGRIHHLNEERTEAAIQYRATRADYDRRKAAAQTAMQNPNALSPEKRQEYEALLRDPPPEFLSRAAFYLALTACENDRFNEALEGFTAFIQQNPASPVLAEAQLRQGFCRLQTGSYAEAIPVLQTLTNQPERSDRALWWIARCQIKLADPKSPAAYGPTMQSATDNLRRAADLAGRLAQTDPDAKVRRGEILMDLADTQVTLRQYKDAADTYQRVLQENAAPTRTEEAMQRRVTALHLGSFYRESDELGTRFEQTYPRSVLLPAVLFRRAENACLAATALATNTASPNRTQELPRLLADAIARYQRLLDQNPDSACVNLAREAMGSCYYRLGKFRDASEVLDAIPPDACVGALANVPYLLADCLIRRSAQNPADAVAASDLLTKAEQAAKLLEGFIAANDKSPQLPDALLKQGWCYSRIAETVRAPEERKRALTSGRAAYERLLQQFPQDPALAVAVFERANCMAALGDTPGAINELNRFTRDPLLGTATAPLALARLAAWLRTQNRGAEAVAALQQYRTQFEGSLLKDPALADRVPPLQYEQALALKQAGKTAEARALFESVMKQFPEHPAAASAAWRAAQSRREELAAQMDAVRQAAARPGAKPEELAAVQRSLSEAINAVRDAVSALQIRADAIGQVAPGSPAHLAALYEIAWSCRALADVEVDTAVRQLRQEAVARVRAKLAQQLPAGQTPATIREPGISLSQVAQPLSERMAIESYERLVKAAPGSPMAAQARLELGEIYASRSQYKPAALVLGAALTGQPSPVILPQIRIRLAAVLLGLQEPRAALVQAKVVASDATSPLAGYARYLMGESYFQQQEWKRATELLVPFRDQGALQNLPDVSDRALLRLGQAYLKTAQPDLCRQTLAAFAQRFPRSVWLDEALYTTGLSLQNQEQYDPAVEAFRQVTGRTASAWGARAQLQIGLCRRSQKRPAEALQALLAVPLTYDYPEWQAAAYVEAARACQELKQSDEASRLLQKVTQQYAESPSAQTARDLLNAMEKTR